MSNNVELIERIDKILSFGYLKKAKSRKYINKHMSFYP